MKRFYLILPVLLILFTCDEPKEEDTVPPTVTITSPQDGSTVSGIVSITCMSSDNEGVEKVELWIDNSNTGIQDDTDPYSLDWNTTNYEDDSYTIVVRSYDTSGNTADSDPITLDVINFIQCDSGYVEIDSSCYWEDDIQFLQILIDNSSLEIDPLELGDQNWEEGRITWFICWSCDLSGVIPLEIGNLSELKELYLNHNQFRGEIPPEIGNLSKIYWLDLQDNQLNGEIPPEVWNLSLLRYLNLYGNQLVGVIPPEIANLFSLEVLHLGHNLLSGEIPVEVGNLSNLQGLYLFGNQLNGEIPPEIGNMSNLEDLHLGDNQLSGEIPPDIENLSNLQGLYLFGNQLSGEIPPEIGNMSNLEDLHLSSNLLSGSIPPEIGDLSKLDKLWLYNNQLSGLISDEICNLNLDWSSPVHFLVWENSLCPPYPDCIEDYMGTQDTTGCD